MEIAMTDQLFLRIFASIGLLYAVTGGAFVAYYGREVGRLIPSMFLSLGTGIFIAVNRWWLLEDLGSDTLVMAVAALFLLVAWLSCIGIVLEHVDQQRRYLASIAEYEEEHGDADADTESHHDE